MSKAKLPVAKVRAKPRVKRRETEQTASEHTGSDIEAFYAAQQESAADSRDYAARRRRR